MNEVTILRESFLLEAITRGLMTHEEYEEQFKNKYTGPADGSDVFFSYLSAVLSFPDCIFITENPQMNLDADMLLDKFGVVIAND
jgi:hypothetical protein